MICGNCVNGWVIIKDQKTCGRCFGSGKESDKSNCLGCKGKGFIETSHKEVCHGTGKIKY